MSPCLPAYRTIFKLANYISQRSQKLEDACFLHFSGIKTRVDLKHESIVVLDTRSLDSSAVDKQET